MQIRSDSANLDFLRACAVLMVLLFHTVGFFNHGLSSALRLYLVGHLGVLLFFVHTSLVLMLSLERQVAKFGPTHLFVLFMTRRVFRIYPLSILVVLIVFLFRLPVAEHPWNMHFIPMGAWGLFANLLLVQNLIGKGSIIGPLWSLPYEIQMYLVLPAIFLLVRRLPSWQWVLGLWALAVGIALFGAPLFGRFGTLFQYAPNFLPGVVAYRLAATSRPRFPAFAWPVVLSGLVLLYVVTDGRENGWLICLFTGLAIPQFEELKNRFWKWASHFVAKYSYGIYLTHYVCLWLSFTRLAFLPEPLQWVVFISTVVCVPIALYHAIEAPLIRVGSSVVGLWAARQPLPTVAEAAPNA